MVRSLAYFLVLLGTCFVAGCGSASGIKPGIPSNPVEPVNPTPDMGPATKGSPKT